MMDAYTHLDMSTADPLGDLAGRMASAGIERALVVETWGADNAGVLGALLKSPLPHLRVAPCFRPQKEQPPPGILNQEAVAALRVKTQDLRRLDRLGSLLESSGKWLLPHAESGIGELTDELILVAMRFPRLRIYVPHLAWPRRNGEDDENWSESVTKLSGIPGLVMGISAISYFSQEPLPHPDVARFASRVLESFEVDSVVIGSDYPMFEKSQYRRYMSLAQQWLYKGGPRQISRFEASCFPYPTVSAE